MPNKPPKVRAVNMARLDWREGRHKSEEDLIKIGFTPEEASAYKRKYDSFPNQSDTIKRLKRAKSCGQKAASKYGEKIPPKAFAKCITEEEKNAFIEGHTERFNKITACPGTVFPIRQPLFLSQTPSPINELSQKEGENAALSENPIQPITPQFCTGTTLPQQLPINSRVTPITFTQTDIPQAALSNPSYSLNLIHINTELKKENSELRYQLATSVSLLLERQNILFQRQKYLAQMEQHPLEDNPKEKTTQIKAQP